MLVLRLVTYPFCPAFTKKYIRLYIDIRDYIMKNSPKTYMLSHREN